MAIPHYAPRARHTRRLLRSALRKWGSEQAWNAVIALHGMGSPELLDAIRKLSAGATWRKRTLGLSLAAQLTRRRPGRTRQQYAPDETRELLLEGLHDPHPEVVRAAVSGLGHRPHPDALAELVRLSTSGDEELRWAVSVALGAYEQVPSTEALVRLMNDSDARVRDWATFSLGSLHETDSVEVRAALWKNVKDDCEDVRGEALAGLVQRRDIGVVGHLLQLDAARWGTYELEAAEALAVPELLAKLHEVSDVQLEDGPQSLRNLSLRRALDACHFESPKNTGRTPAP